MKKSLLLTLDFPPLIGGVANYYANVCQHLDPDKIVVLTLKQWGFGSSATEERGGRTFDQTQKYKIYRTSFFLPIKFGWLLLFWPLYRIVKKEKIELLEVGQVLPLGTVALFFKFLFKIPYWVYSHGMDITCPSRIPRKKRLLKVILQNTKNIITSNHFTKNEIINLGIKNKNIIVVPPCPDLIALSHLNQTQVEVIKKKYHLANQKILLTVGRLIERKGVDYIIEALANVWKKYPDVCYLIVGSGSKEDQLKNLAHHLCANMESKITPLPNSVAAPLSNAAPFQKILFLNDVSPKDLPNYYSLCDIFIMTPRQLANGDVEGFGLVFLEANFFGKPVIAGESGGVKEAVLNNINGLLVNPYSIKAISEAIIKLLDDPSLCQQLGEQGRQRVLKEFRWEQQIRKIKDILNSKSEILNLYVT